MNNTNTIKALEDVLRNFWLDQSQESDMPISEKELKLILASNADSFKMSEEKRNNLINKLYETVNEASLGQLLSAQLKVNKLKDKSLATEVNLPVSIIKELKEDQIYPNNIPVVTIKKLFKKLHIVFDTAESAIIKTFKMLQKDFMLRSAEENPQVAFRRSFNDSKTKSKRTGKHDGRELYENRESLDKYLAKLKELMDADTDNQ